MTQLDMLETQLARRRGAVIATATIGCAAVGTLGAAALVWRSSTSELGLWTQVGGHLLTVVLGAVGLALAVVTTLLPRVALLWASAACSALGGLTCVTALGFAHETDKHTGPAPWFAIAGLAAAAILAASWAREPDAFAPAREPSPERITDARARVRRALQRPVE